MTAPAREANPTLRGITWNHPRGLDSLIACSSEFEQLTGIAVEWTARTLQGFADASLSELSHHFDLLVFDHPHLGQAVAEGAFLPADGNVAQATIEQWRTNSVGPSFESYVYGGHVWGAPIDAAGTVAVWRPDLVETAPATWSDALALASAGPGAMAVALLPIDALTAFFTLVQSGPGGLFRDPDSVVDHAVGEEALELLAEITAVAHPMSLNASPIDILEVMSTRDEVAYSPLVFGYSNYCRDGFRPHLVSFGAFPAHQPGAVHGGVLGGAGLAVSAQTRHAQTAFRFMEYAMLQEVQAGTYTRAGGQPGHRAAWLSPEANALTHDYFASTLPVLDAQYLRPRHPGYLAIQNEGSLVVHEFLSGGGKARDVLEQLDAIHRAATTS